MDLKYQFIFAYLLVVVSFIPIFLFSFSFTETISTSSQNILLFSCILFVLILGILAITGRLYRILYKSALLAVDLTYMSLNLWIHSSRNVPIITIAKHMKHLNSNKGSNNTSYVSVTKVADVDPEFAANTFYFKNDRTKQPDPDYNLDQETVFVTFLKGHFYGSFHLDPSDINLNDFTEMPSIESAYHAKCNLCLDNATVLRLNLSDSVRDIETDEAPICESCLDELLQELMNEIDPQYHRKIAAKAL